MSNPKFLAVDLAIPTYTWKTSAGADNNNSSFPVDKLKTYFPDEVSKSNSTGSDQYLLIDLGSALPCNAVVIEGHNFATVDPDTEIDLQYNTNDDTNWADAVTAVIIMQTGAYTNTVVLKTFAAQTKRYWRILFKSTAAVAPQIGNIFLGTSLDFETTQQWGFSTNVPSSPKVSRIRSLDNRLRTSSVGSDIRKHTITFDQGNSQTDALIANYLIFLALTHNGALPFYYVDNNGAVFLVNFANDYNPYEAFRYNKNKIPDLSMESTMADA